MRNGVVEKATRDYAVLKDYMNFLAKITQSVKNFNIDLLAVPVMKITMYCKIR